MIKKSLKSLNILSHKKEYFYSQEGIFLGFERLIFKNRPEPPAGYNIKNGPWIPLPCIHLNHVPVLRYILLF